jgi:hypothetical protein
MPNYGKLMHMSLFEQYLTYGDEICQDEKISLYKFLLIDQRSRYIKDAKQLLKEKTLVRRIAKGEVNYSIQSGKVSYISRKIGTDSFTHKIRELDLGFFPRRRISKLARFFAQAEVDVLSNYPISIDAVVPENGFGYLAFPYYDLNYYSQGKGRLIGFFKMLQSKDDDLLEKLLASSRH